MSKKILIIDDDERLVGLYAMALKNQGYEVETSLDGKTGLSKIAEAKPDLVLLDVMMPVVSGFVTLDTIKSMPDTENIKVVMLTALSDDKMKERALSLGADDYIVKTQLNVVEVIERINNLFKSSK